MNENTNALAGCLIILITALFSGLVCSGLGLTLGYLFWAR